MKSLINLASLSLLLLAASCAHKNLPAHHHHKDACENDKCALNEECKIEKCEKEECEGENKCQMFEKKCAYLVSHGDPHVEGKDEFKLEHEGHTYYFSTKERMEEFKKNIKKNVERANRNWHHYNQFNRI